MIREHWGQHDADCFGCKCATIQFAPSAMENRSPEAARLVRDEKALDKNMTAYKGLVKSGVQPASLGRAKMLEDRATTEHEITSGQIARSPQYAKTVERVMRADTDTFAK